jgi:hypothetical protein
VCACRSDARKMQLIEREKERKEEETIHKEG